MWLPLFAPPLALQHRGERVKFFEPEPFNARKHGGWFATMYVMPGAGGQENDQSGLRMVTCNPPLELGEIPRDRDDVEASEKRLWLLRPRRERPSCRAAEERDELFPTVSILMLTHALEGIVWSLAYSIVDAAPAAANLVYFAFVNYTTLGYGDVVPVERWRLLGPMTAMNGVLLFGWSTAVIFEVLRKVLERLELAGRE